MNIIKFKNKSKEGDDIYNNTFNGRYCYAIAWKWAMSLDVSEQDITAIEQGAVNINAIGSPYITIQDYIDYVDNTETNDINRVDKYRLLNDNVINTDIPLEDLKNFRTWLAKSLLDLDLKIDDKTRYMLEYYANNKSNNVTLQLSLFNTSNTTISTLTTKHTCLCQTNTLNLNIDPYINCNPLATYRDEIYKHMTTVFGDLYFWIDQDINFLKLFKQYIDGIIAHNLPLNNDFKSNIINYCDCSCDTTLEGIQRQLQQQLKMLSESLEYIIGDDIVGHKNFINDTFRVWAIDLYDKMIWV